MTNRTASCPGCGGTLTFRSAATVCVVCPFCGGASYRTDVDLEYLGKAAEVVPIASPLELGGSGRFEGKAWTAVGQLQLDHGAGPWNEWCLLFDDGSWGWYAEAQGETLFTRRVEGAESGVPAWSTLQPGSHVSVGEGKDLVVAEIGEAKVTAVKGELPSRVTAGSSVHYADLRGSGSKFGTLDFGPGETCESVYLGRTVDPLELGLDPEKAEPVAVGVSAARLSCPQCAGIIELRDPASLRVVCQSCGTLIEPRATGAKALGVGAALQARPEIPLGAEGLLRGEQLQAIAYLVRSVTVAGIPYRWREYLLKSRKGAYRWLAESGHHWALLAPVNPGDVKGKASPVFQGVTFKHFQTGNARVDHVQGEVYWKVEVGEMVKSEDFVAPPRLLTIEGSGKEINVTAGEYLPKAELETAFGVTLPEPVGVAPSQPNPFKDRVGKYWGAGCLYTLALIVLMVVVGNLKGSDHVGVFFPGLFLLGGLLVPPIVVSTRSSTFEVRRWQDSDHPMGDSGGSDDDEEEDEDEEEEDDDDDDE